MPIRSTNWRKYLIAKKATNAEVINPTSSWLLKISKLAVIESPIKKISAPKMVGIAKRNANLDESFKFNPKNKQAMITTPDLEAPGINANIWTQPIKKLIRIDKWNMSLFFVDI